MSPDMAGFGFENRPVRGPGLQKYGNTSIPVFPKPSRRALAPGFGALETQPALKLGVARLKTRPSEIRKYRYFRISEITGNAFKQAIQFRGHRLKNTSARNTEIPVFPYFRQPGRRALAPGFGALERFTIDCSELLCFDIHIGGPEDEGLFDGSQRTGLRCS